MITQQDIQDLYGEELLYILADRDRDQVLDTVAIEKACESAWSQIETYLLKRYSHAQIAASKDVKRLAVDIAVYRLGVSADAYTKEQRQRYEDALHQLELMAAGKIGIGLPEEIAPPTSDVRDGELLVVNNERLFTRDRMRGL